MLIELFHGSWNQGPARRLINLLTLRNLLMAHTGEERKDDDGPLTYSQRVQQLDLVLDRSQVEKSRAIDQ